MSRRKGRPAKSMGRFVTIAGRATNVSLEDAFWQSLKEIASERDTTRSELVAKIDSERQEGNLSSAIRPAANSCQQAPPYQGMIAKTGFDSGAG